MTSTFATFRIDGRHYSNLARQLVVDGEWRKGLKMLIDQFEGMTHEYAFLILKGTHILDGVGDNIRLIEENDADYKSSVDDIYCHDLFYHGNELYRFEEIIEHREMQSDLYSRGVNFDIPAWDNYVKTYMNPEDFEFFDVSVNDNKFRALLASKANINALPIWFDKKDFAQNAKAFADKNMPFKSTIDDILNKKFEDSQKRHGVSDVDDFYTQSRKQRAISTAQSFGFDNIKDFSADIREKVMETIFERGVEWRTIQVEFEGVVEEVKYPYELALNYALNRTYLSNFAPSWKPVSPESVKIDDDLQVHSDLWVALGNDFDGCEYVQSSKANTILKKLVSELQKESFPAGEFVTLNSAGLVNFTGRVVKHYSKDINKNDILVIPHAGPEFEIQARQAGLVICEVGGKLAHLVIVGREFGLPMVRIHNACSMFQDRMQLTLDFKNATIVAAQ